MRGDLSEFADARFEDRDTFAGEVADMKFIDAVAAVMARRMELDPSIVVMGEDVHRLAGGTNGATKGLKDAFPDRVLGTPISENAFTGLAGGMALDGRFRPVVEFMYADFMWVAADQLFNQIGKARHMFGGNDSVPLVLRSKVAMGTGYGSQHSMDPAAIFVSAPGWRIVAPSTPFDYVGLMNSALRCEDPVLVIEHVDLYASTGEGPVDDLDYCLPVGKAAVRRTGSDVTVITYLAMTQYVLDAVAEVGTRRRRGHRPALARPGEHRLGHDRREHQEDQQRAHRGAGRAGHRLRRLAVRRDPAALLRLARPADPAGHRRRGLARASARCSSGRPSPAAKRSSRRCWPCRRPPMPELLRMPEIAAGATHAVLSHWPQPANEAYAVATVIAIIETDKAVVDVEAETDGVILRTLVEEGAEVAIGDPIALHRRARRGRRRRRRGAGHPDRLRRRRRLPATGRSPLPPRPLAAVAVSGPSRPRASSPARWHDGSPRSAAWTSPACTAPDRADASGAAMSSRRQPATAIRGRPAAAPHPRHPSPRRRRGRPPRQPAASSTCPTPDCAGPSRRG